MGSITHCYFTVVRQSDSFLIPFNAVYLQMRLGDYLGKNNNESDSQIYLFFKCCNSGLQTYVGTLVCTSVLTI